MCGLPHDVGGARLQLIPSGAGKTDAILRRRRRRCRCRCRGRGRRGRRCRCRRRRCRRRHCHRRRRRRHDDVTTFVPVCKTPHAAGTRLFQVPIAAIELNAETYILLTTRACCRHSSMSCRVRAFREARTALQIITQANVVLATGCSCWRATMTSALHLLTVGAAVLVTSAACQLATLVI